jgi:hypothetical protein
MYGGVCRGKRGHRVETRIVVLEKVGEKTRRHLGIEIDHIQDFI